MQIRLYGLFLLTLQTEMGEHYKISLLIKQLKDK